MRPVYVERPASARGSDALGLVAAGGVTLVVAVAGLVAGAPTPLVIALVCAPYLALLVGQPTLRRLAVRNTVRRPAESALVLLGALLGTAVITGGFVVQDSLTASVNQRAYSQLGPVDEIVRSSGSAAGRAVAQSVAARPPNGIAGSLPMLSLAAPVLSTSAVPAAAPHAQVLELDFATGRQFGGVPSRTGLSGGTPAPG